MQGQAPTMSAEPNTAPSTPPMPDPENLKPAGLSDRQKRWIFFGVAGRNSVHHSGEHGRDQCSRAGETS